MRGYLIALVFLIVEVYKYNENTMKNGKRRKSNII